MLANNPTANYDAPTQIKDEGPPVSGPFNDLKILAEMISEDKFISGAELETYQQRILKEI